jgi:N-acetyl-gamma-glutamyl-phosphate reductase
LAPPNTREEEKMIKVGVVGGTGYTGVELLSLLAVHPQVEVKCVTSRSEAGMPVADLYPSLRGWIDVPFTEPDVELLASCDLVFFATPNGIAMGQAQALLDRDTRIVDLSADFRIKDVAEWERWYGMAHTSPDLVNEAVYGLPEMNRAQIKQARLVANPGCYPTAVQLGFLPLLENGLVELDNLVADCKSGVSGAGRGAAVATLFSEVSDSFKAYGVKGHRHLPEIVQGLNQMQSEQKATLTFVPHLVPMIRGIHATLYARLKPGADADLQSLFEQRFADEPFVDVMPAGSHPETRWVKGSNMVRLAVHRPVDSPNVVVLATEDNLVKGAAGQAVQNMNLMFDLDETLGLDKPARLP